MIFLPCVCLREINSSYDLTLSINVEKSPEERSRNTTSYFAWSAIYVSGKNTTSKLEMSFIISFLFSRTCVNLHFYNLHSMNIWDIKSMELILGWVTWM